MEKKKPKDKVYAIYKGDKFIDLGTKKELSERLGVKERTIKFYSSPSYLKRKAESKEPYMIAIEVEDEE